MAAAVAVVVARCEEINAEENNEDAEGETGHVVLDEFGHEELSKEDASVQRREEGPEHLEQRNNKERFEESQLHGLFVGRVFFGIFIR